MVSEPVLTKVKRLCRMDKELEELQEGLWASIEREVDKAGLSDIEIQDLFDIIVNEGDK